MSFEANQGQTDPQVDFLSRGSSYTLFLTPTEAVLTLRQPMAAGQVDIDTLSSSGDFDEPGAAPTVLRMQLVGANPKSVAVGVDGLPGKSNYFIGNNPERWRTGIPHFRRVLYEEVYRGVDLVYYGTDQRQLEYDFIVAPGADPKAITLNFEGGDSLEVEGEGNLLLRLAGGEVRFRKPYIYQETGRIRQEIAGGYALNDDSQVTFELASYDASKPLVIDPVLEYSTYLGGSSFDLGRAIAVDSAGHAYVAGRTRSIDFPTANPLQPVFGGGSTDAFVAKLSLSGSTLVYATYLGGNSFDNGHGIAVDDAGNAYVTGGACSTGFPTMNALQPVLQGSCDAFVAKLNPSGSALVYSTYLGGDEQVLERGQGIAVDNAGYAYVTGETSSTDFPTAKPLQATFGGSDADAFVAKLNPSGSSLVYSTYLGGTAYDTGFSIAVDRIGRAYVTGRTRSIDFPMEKPLQPALGGGADVFVAKLNPAGSALVYSTYLGGNTQDQGHFIAVDSAGYAYVTGETRSTNFPTANPLQPVNGGGIDPFVAKLNPTGSALVYSTYLGGSGSGTGLERGWGIAVDNAGNAYVSGATSSIDFPIVSPLQAVFGGGGSDAFVVKLSPTGSSLVYSTYLGGSGFDRAPGIAIDNAGNAYVTGITASADFPTVNAVQPVFAGPPGGPFSSAGDAFVAKIVRAIDIKPEIDPNTVNPSDNGLLAVAILTRSTFAAQTISPITVQFGPDGASITHSSGHLTDVDMDGDLDLLLHFSIQDTGIQCGDTEASLSGETFGGESFQASDSIVTVGCN